MRILIKSMYVNVMMVKVDMIVVKNYVLIQMCWKYNKIIMRMKLERLNMIMLIKDLKVI